MTDHSSPAWAHGGSQHACTQTCPGWQRVRVSVQHDMGTPGRDRTKDRFQDGVEAERKRITDRINQYPTALLPRQLVIDIVSGGPK